MLRLPSPFRRRPSWLPVMPYSFWRTRRAKRSYGPQLSLTRSTQVRGSAGLTGFPTPPPSRLASPTSDPPSLREAWRSSLEVIQPLELAALQSAASVTPIDRMTPRPSDPASAHPPVPEIRDNLLELVPLPAHLQSSSRLRTPSGRTR